MDNFTFVTVFLSISFLCFPSEIQASSISSCFYGCSKIHCAFLPHTLISLRGTIQAPHGTTQKNMIHWHRHLRMANDDEKSIQKRNSNFFVQYLEDIADYLDQKGGYVITEQQLKGGLKQNDLDSIKQAFDRPKRKPAELSINLFLISITALPLLAWFKFALDDPCAMLHLC